MDLTSANPFGRVENGPIETYRPLADDVSCDVAVVGAGISGALLAERLTRSGRKVVVLDRGIAVSGSTSASTSLLQYETDLTLVAMSRLIGHSAAERAYQLTYQAIDRLAELVAGLPTDCGFQRKQSLYVASHPRDAAALEIEVAARRSCGFDVRLVDGGELDEVYGVHFSSAIVSTQAATVDAYRLAHTLLQLTVAGGGDVYERTSVVGYESHGGRTRLRTDRGPIVDARQVVIATGYETQEKLREKVVNLKSTYAIVTRPLASLEPWSENWILWETERPYFYMRAASSDRLIAGGEDDFVLDPVERDRQVPAKSAVLLGKLRHLFPRMDVDVDYGWAGTFGETKDSLPYIGQSPELPECLFALCFGGNGITFSSMAADLLCRRIDGQVVPELDLFRFGRW